MLELLARGLRNNEIASQLGYRPGTMRVYLHGLYAKIGVNSKTAAVVWYAKQKASTTAPAEAAPTAGQGIGESFGDIAVRTSLLAALGVMSVFLGAYSRIWEVSMRLKGEEISLADRLRRDQSRQIWEALLRGDWPYAKAVYDGAQLASMVAESPFECAMLACMLLIGGYTSAADRVLELLPARKPGAQGIKASEMRLLLLLRDATNSLSFAKIEELHQMVATYSTNHAFKHLAMVIVHYVYRQGADGARARQSADAIWAEADMIRQHLVDIGEKPLPISNSLPEPARMADSKASRRTEQVVTS
jgi:hypothetical protein